MQLHEHRRRAVLRRDDRRTPRCRTSPARADRSPTRTAARSSSASTRRSRSRRCRSRVRRAVEFTIDHRSRDSSFLRLRRREADTGSSTARRSTARAPPLRRTCPDRSSTRALRISVACWMNVACALGPRVDRQRRIEVRRRAVEHLRVGQRRTVRTRHRPPCAPAECRCSSSRRATSRGSRAPCTARRCRRCCRGCNCCTASIASRTKPRFCVTLVYGIDGLSSPIDRWSMS